MQQHETQDGVLRRQNRRVLIVLVLIFIALAAVAVARMIWRPGL
jgi:hypothetical protein